MNAACVSCASFVRDQSAIDLLGKLGRHGSDYGWCRGIRSPRTDCLVSPRHDACDKYDGPPTHLLPRAPQPEC